MVFHRPGWSLPADMGLRGASVRMIFRAVVQIDVEILLRQATVVFLPVHPNGICLIRTCIIC